ncbi:Uncharacterised protein [uncultured archaeon]|nr:Uncharacterised protein [uncultured archaeon]
MRHIARKLCFDAHVHTACVLLPKKTVEKRLPMAEKAYELTRREPEKLAAFGAALFVPVPDDRLNTVINLLWRNERDLPGGPRHIARMMRLLGEYKLLRQLDSKPITGLREMKCYEKELLRGSVTPTAIAVRVAELSENVRGVDPRKLLYVYSALAEVLDPAFGQALRKEAVRLLYPERSAALTRAISERADSVQGVCEKVQRLGGEVATNVVRISARIKNGTSAALKFVEKGYLNDIVGISLECRTAKDAVESSRRVQHVLASTPDVRIISIKDYYAAPKDTAFCARQINCEVDGVPVEVRVMDSESLRIEKSLAPHGIHKSYGVLTMQLVPVFQDYLQAA